MSLPYGTFGYWTDKRLLYVSEVELDIEIPEIDLLIEVPEIILEVEITEVELEND